MQISKTKTFTLTFSSNVKQNYFFSPSLTREEETNEKEEERKGEGEERGRKREKEGERGRKREKEEERGRKCMSGKRVSSSQKGKKRIKFETLLNWMMCQIISFPIKSLIGKGEKGLGSFVIIILSLISLSLFCLSPFLPHHKWILPSLKSEKKFSILKRSGCVLLILFWLTNC